MQSAKNDLDKTYVELQECDLDKLLQRAENVDGLRKTKESWKIINEISGRRVAKRGIIKGTSREDRIKQWEKHFSGLLGNVPDVAGSDNDHIQPVLEGININDGPFTGLDIRFLS